MKIIATPCIGRDLRPGDLFSTAGPEYWDTYEERGSIGERVYIRTCEPSGNAPDASEVVYRIEVVKEMVQ